MKARFSIKEVANMYNVSTHTLRHYEKLKLLCPQRTENNYRFFTAQDIYRLNIIRDLRGLNISLEKIQYHLESRNLAETMNLLTAGEKRLKKQQRELEQKILGIQKRMNILKKLTSKHPSMNELILSEKAPRYSIQKKVEFQSESEFEINRRELYSELVSETHFYDFHFVASISRYKDKQLIYEGLLMLVESDTVLTTKQQLLPAGLYASYLYKGSYEQSQKIIAHMVQKLKKMNCRLASPFYEFYLIDFHETNDMKEFLTEIQVRIEKP